MFATFWLAAAVLHSVVASTAAVKPRSLLLAETVDIGLGTNSLGSSDQSNIGPTHTAWYGVEFAWTLTRNDASPGNVDVQMEQIELRALKGGPRYGCLNTLSVPDASSDRGVSFFNMELKISTTSGSGSSVVVEQVQGFTDCSKGSRRQVRGLWLKKFLQQQQAQQEKIEAANKAAAEAKAALGFTALPKGAELQFEFTHILWSVIEIEQSSGSECWAAGVDIWRPQSGSCDSAECNRSMGLSRFEFGWKQDSGSPAVEQCYISGDAARLSAPRARLNQIFEWVDSNGDGVVRIDEFKEFWKVDMQAELTDATLDEWFDTVDRQANGVANNRISQAEFSKALSKANVLVEGHVLSEDNVVAYQMYKRCEESGYPTGCDGYRRD